MWLTWRFSLDGDRPKLRPEARLGHYRIAEFGFDFVDWWGLARYFSRPSWPVTGHFGRSTGQFGAVAQLGERLVRNEEVRGSIPLSSMGSWELGAWSRELLEMWRLGLVQGARFADGVGS